MSRRPAFLMCFWLFIGCQGEPNLPPPIFVDESAVVFDTTVLHEVELIVAPEFLDDLVPGNEVRVPATIIYDGVRVENVGIRLKGLFGSVQNLDGKPGFSVKFNEFVEGQKLFGLKKFTLNNAIQDPSFVSEHLGYEIWRRAGVPAPRTAHARLTFNGEYFGVYVVKESINSTFAKQNFEDGSGNIYEGTFRVDVTDTDVIDLDSNTEINDRSDIIALSDIILSSPDETFLEDISALVDLDEFMTYWAVEALTYHWDGYGVAQPANGCCSPNNYIIYFEPSLGRFFFLPHGADQLFQDLNVNVLTPPSPVASLATRLFAFEEIRQRLADEIRRVLVKAWDAEALEARMDAAIELIEDSVLEFDRNPNFNPQNFPNAVESRRRFLRERPAIALENLANAGL